MISGNPMERAITANNCPECGEPRGPHIYRHLMSVHAWTPERVEALKVEGRNRKALEENGDGEVLWCECGLLFKTSRGLRKHRNEKKHGILEPSLISCPLCEATVKDHEGLVGHASLYHADSTNDYKIEMETFRDKKDFEVWKSELEGKTLARFRIIRSKKRPSWLDTHYVCSRAAPNPSYRHAKTKKVVPYCTAHMKVRQSAEKIVVRFCKAHFCHKVEPGLLSLDRKSTKDVVSLLKDGSGAHQIVDRVRKENRENENLPIAMEVELDASPVGLSLGPSSVQESCTSADPYSADNAYVPDNSEMMLHKFNEIRTYWCGIQANLYSMMKHPSDESIQRMDQLAECMKQHYMDTQVENSDTQKRRRRLTRRSEISEVGRLPKHPTIRMEKRSVLDARKHRRIAKEVDLIEYET